MSDDTEPEVTHRPPSTWRNPWVLLSAGALVVLAALSGLSIWRTTPASDGRASRESAPGITTPSTRTVPTSSLDTLLLSPEQVSALTHAPGLKPDPVEHDMADPTYTVSRAECLSALHAVARPAYQGSAWTAVSAQYLAEPGTSIDHEVRQGVVAFPSADEADAFVASSLTKWKSCVGHTVEVTSAEGVTRRATFENLTGFVPFISLFTTMDAPPGWACQRVLRAMSNAVVDVGVCGRGITDDASRLTHEISANINKIR